MCFLVHKHNATAKPSYNSAFHVASDKVLPAPSQQDIIHVLQLLWKIKRLKSGLIWTNYAFEWILYCDRCTVCILVKLELRELGVDVPAVHTAADATNGHCYYLYILVYEHAAFTWTFVRYKWFSTKVKLLDLRTAPALLSIFCSKYFISNKWMER